MKLVSLILVLLCACLAQPPATTNAPLGGARPMSDADVALTKSQRNALIKADHQKNLEDSAALLRLAQELSSDIEREDSLIISVKNVKRTEDIQKLAKNIHGRLKRY